jgi:pimeloyl-ACP methyl ester carboxylesterase
VSGHCGVAAAAGLAVAAALAAGCGEVATVGLPPVGVPQPLAYVVQQKRTGPISIIFPGRSAPTDDVTLGIRETALRVAERAGGSVGLFSWKVYAQARRWAAREAALRRAAGERVRIALVGHSWGGPTATRFAEESLADGLVDEVSILVTLDAIDKGYGKNATEWWLALVPEAIFQVRWPMMAFTGGPLVDGTRVRRHVNYYQLDSPMLAPQNSPTVTGHGCR